MSTNLIQYLKCKRNVSAKGFSLGSVLSGFANKAQAYVRTTVSATIGSLVDKANSAIENATSKIRALGDLAISEYYGAKSLIANIETQISEGIDKIEGFINPTCTEAETFDPAKPTVNVIASLNAVPKTNDDKVNDVSPDIQVMQQLDDAKTIGIDAISNTIGAIENQLSQKTIPEQREYVRLLKDSHPLLIGYINSLSHFQPVSEYVGSTYLAYTPDKPSLQLEKWADSAEAVRRNIKHKVGISTYATINNAYNDLNKKFVSNISNEFYGERTIGLKTAHSYHIAGDYSFIVDHINPLLKQLSVLYNALLGQTAILVNYLYPITENITITNETYELPNNIVVDNKGTPIRKPPETVNNTALQPIV